MRICQEYVEEQEREDKNSGDQDGNNPLLLVVLDAINTIEQED